MNFSFVAADASKAKADVLVVPVFDTDLTEKKNPPRALQSIDKKTRGLLFKTALSEGFKGKAEQTFVFLTHGKVPAVRVILVGLGARAKFTAELLRLAAGRAVKISTRMKAKIVAVQLPVVRELEHAVKAVVEGFELGVYKYDRWKTLNKDDKNAPKIDKVAL